MECNTVCLFNIPELSLQFSRSFSCLCVCIFTPLPLTLILTLVHTPLSLYSLSLAFLLHQTVFQLFFVCLSDVFDLKCVLRGASAITHEVFIIHKEARPGLFMVYKPLRLRLRGLYTYNNLRLRLRSLYKIIHLASLGGIIY